MRIYPAPCNDRLPSRTSRFCSSRFLKWTVLRSGPSSMLRARDENCSEKSDSSAVSAVGLMAQSKTALALPPKPSCNSDVSLELRNGT